MKKQIILAVSILALSATTSKAEFYGKTSYIIGQTTVQNASGIKANGYGIELGYQIPTKWFSIGIEKTQLSHGNPNEKVASYFGPPLTDLYLENYDLDALTVNGTFYLASFDTWRPYLGLSFGKVKISEERRENSTINSMSSSITQFSYKIGFETRVSQNLFVDTAFTRRSASSESRAGSNQADGFRGMDFSLGVKYLF